MTSTGILASTAIALMLAMPASAQIVPGGGGSTAGSFVAQSSANATSPDRAAEVVGSQSATTSTAGVVASRSVPQVNAPYIAAILDGGASRRNDQPPVALSADVTTDDEVLAGGPKTTVQNFAGANYAGVVSNAIASEPAIVSPP